MSQADYQPQRPSRLLRWLLSLQSYPRLLRILPPCLLVMVMVLDYSTGFRWGFGLLYLLPVLLVALRPGYRLLWSIIVVAGLSWSLIEMLAGFPYQHWGQPVWNLLMRLGMLSLAGFAMQGLAQSHQQAWQLATQDSLTGLANRRAFLDALASNIERSRRHPSYRFALCYLDLDRFKHINDHYSHQQGDQLLAACGAALKQQMRQHELAGRLGGDEFALLLECQQLSALQQALARIQQPLAALLQPYQAGVSMGAVLFEQAPVSVEQALHLADALMYQSKQHEPGGFHSQCWPTPVANSP